MNTRAYTLQTPIWHKISTKGLFFMFAGLMVALSFLYVFLINKTIMNVVARTNNQKASAVLSSKLSEMETDYISLQNSITINVAYSKGFVDTNASQFISRDQSLTYNTR